MSDFHLVDPQGFEYDLQSVYSAYMGYFQLHALPWHDRTWSQYFESFEQFLAFSWPVVTVTDTRTGRAHIVTRVNSINAFLKMIKTRFGETIPQVDNMFRIKPVETSQRHLRHVNDWASYKKLHSALPAVALSALKGRVRAGDPSAIRDLWTSRDKTFLTIDFKCPEKNDRACVEWGYAAIRSSHLEAVGAWPPSPNTNYRKGHYIVSEYADKFNKGSPSLSWQYAFGDSQVIPKAKLSRIVQSVLSGLVSPESETVANNVVLVGHGVQAIMQRLEDMKIKLPNNLLVVDISYVERALFTTGERGQMIDRKTGVTRVPESLLSLRGLLHSFGVDPPCALHNAGNDAFMTLVLFQRMVDPRGTTALLKGVPNGNRAGHAHGNGNGVDRQVPNGNANAHVKRAASVASRLFRPLSVAHLDLGKNGKENGHGNAALSQTQPQARVGRLSADAVDEMGANVNMNMKRASMFSGLASPTAPTLPLLAFADQQKHKKETSPAGSTRSGRWLAPSAMNNSQKRYSVMQLSNFGG